MSLRRRKLVEKRPRDFQERQSPKLVERQDDNRDTLSRMVAGNREMEADFERALRSPSS